MLCSFFCVLHQPYGGGDWNIHELSAHLVCADALLSLLCLHTLPLLYLPARLVMLIHRLTTTKQWTLWESVLSIHEYTKLHWLLQDKGRMGGGGVHWESAEVRNKWRLSWDERRWAGNPEIIGSKSVSGSGQQEGPLRLPHMTQWELRILQFEPNQKGTCWFKFHF